jgi:hypothetical protein
MPQKVNSASTCNANYYERPISLSHPPVGWRISSKALSKSLLLELLADPSRTCHDGLSRSIKIGGALPHDRSRLWTINRDLGRQ